MSSKCPLDKHFQFDSGKSNSSSEKKISKKEKNKDNAKQDKPRKKSKFVSKPPADIFTEINNIKFHENKKISKKIRNKFRKIQDINKFLANDNGNAEFFLHLYENYIRYNPDSGSWFIFNSKYWQEDAERKILIYAENSMRVYHLLATSMDDKKLIRHGVNSGNYSALKNLCALAAPKCSCCTNDFNQKKHLLNVKNGTINLKTKELYKHDYRDMITYIIDVKYDEDTDMSFIKNFISDISDKDSELASYIQIMYGYAITGEVSEQCIFIEDGNGANGKSTLNEAIKNIAFQYCEQVSYSLFEENSKTSANAPTPELAKLVNKRIAICSETSDKAINEAIIKWLTGDTYISARALYGKPFNFLPQFTIIFETNTLPKITGTDYGIWRRLIVIPFKVTFKKDTTFKNKLLKKKKELLRWLVEGAYIFYNEGFPKCDAVKKASEKYRYSEDTVALYAESCLTTKPGNNISASKVYSNYQKFCENNMLSSLDIKKFKKTMEQKKFKTKRNNDGVKWTNIAFK